MGIINMAFLSLFFTSTLLLILILNCDQINDDCIACGQIEGKSETDDLLQKLLIFKTLIF